MYAAAPVRLGARKVSCVYRRRREDMTALPEEVEGAVAEGVELVTLQAPVRIETDEARTMRSRSGRSRRSSARWMIRAGPSPEKAKLFEKRIRGGWDRSRHRTGRGNTRLRAEQDHHQARRHCCAEASSQIDNMDGVFAGGDCVTGPATVIRAIAAGKVAAANIDEYLGYHHVIDVDVEVPTARLTNKPPRGRINTTEREAERAQARLQVHRVRHDGRGGLRRRRPAACAATTSATAFSREGGRANGKM